MRAAGVLAAVLAVLMLLFSGCGSAAATYTEYVQAVMDCTYYGKTDEYIRLTGVTEAEALALHETQVQRTAKLICTQMTVKPEMLSETTMEGYTALSERLLEQVQYTVNPAVKAMDCYQISIISEPLDLWKAALRDVERLYSRKFAEQFAKAEDNPLRLSRLEKEWGREVLEILSEHAQEAGHQEPVSTIIRLTADENGRCSVSEGSWLYIDNLLLDITWRYEE